MATIGENLRAMVLAIPEVAALVDDRMGQSKVDQDDPMPYIFYRRISEEEDTDLDGTPAGLITAIWTIEAVSRSLDESIRIADLIRRDGTGSLHGYFGAFGDQYARSVQVTDKDDSYIYVNPTDSGLYVTAITVSIIFNGS